MKKLLFIFLLLLFFHPPAQPDSLPRRSLRVGIAVAPGFKTQPNWREEFERRLAYASRIFENEFGLGFRPAIYWNWFFGDEEREMGELLNDLRGRFPLKEVDVVVGLCHLKKIPEDGRIQDLHTLGQASPFSGYLVIRYPLRRLFKIQEETVLIHELGHLFGAVHTDEPETVMASWVERQIPRRFDPENNQIISLTRSIDFKNGIQVLDRNTIELLLQSYLKLIVKDQPYEFFYVLGILYLQLGKQEDALKSWKAAARLNDQNAQIHFDMGMLYFTMEQRKKAISELSRAISFYTLPGQNGDKAQALKYLGEAYFEEGNFLAAYDAWSRASTLQPEDLELKTDLAAVLLKRGQFDEAIRLLRKVLEKNAEYLKAVLNLGIAYYETGQFDQAYQYLQLALQKSETEKPSFFSRNQYADIHQYLGDIYFKGNKLSEALSHYKTVCEIKPTVDCHKRLGEALSQAGEWDAAIQQFAWVLQQEKQDPDVYGLLGTAFAQKGRVEDALSVFREGLRYAKNNQQGAQFHKNMGNLLLGTRHFDLAATEFRYGLAKDWNNLDCQMGLALAYMGNNQPLEAREALLNVLRLDPNHEKAKTMLANIETSIAEELI